MREDRGCRNGNPLVAVDEEVVLIQVDGVGQSRLVHVAVEALGDRLVGIPWALLAGSSLDIRGFLLLGLATTNLNYGISTWLVRHPGHERRATYAGLANTITAIVSVIVSVIAGTIPRRYGFVQPGLRAAPTPATVDVTEHCMTHRRLGMKDP